MAVGGSRLQVCQLRALLTAGACRAHRLRWLLEPGHIWLPCLPPSPPMQSICRAAADLADWLGMLASGQHASEPADQNLLAAQAVQGRL